MKIDQVIKNPLATEKAIRLLDTENKLLFVVSIKSNKKEIKKAVEKMFDVKVQNVNSFVTSRGEKRAYVKLSHETPAIDVMTRLGLM